MKKLSSPILLILSVLCSGMAGCKTTSLNNKNAFERDYALSESFSSIETGGVVNVVLEKGSTASVSVSAQGIAPENVTIQVKDAVLLVTTRGKPNNEKMTIRVTYDQLEELTIGGSSMVQSKAEIRSKTIRLVLKDSAEAVLQVDVDSLSIEMHDSADLKISGQAKNQNVRSFSSIGTLDNKQLALDET